MALEEPLDPSLGALLAHGPCPQLSYQLVCRIALMLGALFGHPIEKSKFVYALQGHRKQLAMYPILGSHTATQMWRFSFWDRSVSPASPPSVLIAYTNEDVRRGLGKYIGGNS